MSGSIPSFFFISFLHSSGEELADGEIPGSMALLY